MILYPKMKEPKINEANYTTLLKDITSQNLNTIKLLMHSFNNTDDLYDMFMSIYRYYEINDTDESVFVQCVSDTFNEHLSYYKELYDNYTKQYDYATGNKRVTSRSDNSSTTKQEVVNTTTNNDSKHYDLPHKNVQDTLVDGYLDDVTKDSGSGNTTGSGNSSNTYGSIVTTQYDNEFLTLKRQYLSQIRNVNEEFCMKFKDCFLSVYS